jgi:hypothetical protein
MRSIALVVLVSLLGVAILPGSGRAQADVNLADLVLAIRKGLIAAQQREVDQNLPPLFLVKDIEMTLTVTVEKGAQGGINVKVVSVGATLDRTDTHTIKIRSEVVIADEFKARLVKCLQQPPQSTYVACFKRVEKELGIPRVGGVSR